LDSPEHKDKYEDREDLPTINEEPENEQRRYLNQEELEKLFKTNSKEA